MDERRRRKWIVLGVAGAAVAGGLATAWSWWLPALVRSRATGVIESRLGIDARIGDVSIGFGRAFLHDVVLEGREGGLNISVPEVDVEASVWGLLSRGAAGIRRVRARDAEVDIDLADGAARSLAQVRRRFGAARDDAEDESGGEGSSRAYAVDDLQLRVKDDRGVLLRSEGSSLRKAGSSLRLSAAGLELGGEGDHSVRVSGAEVRMRRAPDAGWQLEHASVREGTVRWAGRGEVELDEPPADPSAGQGAAAGDAPTPAAAGVDAGAAVDGGSAPEPDRAPQRPGAGTGSGTGGRLRAVAEAIGAAGGRGASADGPSADREDGEQGSRLERWVRRFAPDVELQIDDLVVRAGTDGDARTILRRLRAGLRGAGDGVFRATGAGQAETGGSIRWDVELEPLEARAEGNIRFDLLPLALVAPLLPAVPWYEPENARLDGSLEVRAETAARFAVNGRVGLQGAALASSRIAEEPVRGVDLSMRGEGYWFPVERRLRIDSASVELGEAEASLEGALEWAPEHYLIDLKGTLPPTPCNAAVGAIPADLLGELREFSWQGSMGGRVVVRIDSRELDDSKVDIDVADGCEFATVPSLADLRRVQSPFVHRVREPAGEMFEMTTGPGTPNWVPLDAISPFMVHAAIAHEDASFFHHGGFAPWAIEKAVIRNLKAGRYVLGASTITMQLAKNLFLKREKTLARKVQEVILTWWLESALDKSSIIELYLNVIEYGPGIYGIRNAAMHYFGRPAWELSPAESAFLACILPSPKRYYSSYEQGSLSRSMRRKVERFLRHMHTKGRLDDAALEYATGELEAFSFHPEGAPVPPKRDIPGEAKPLPYQAPSAEPLPFDTGWTDWDDDELDWGPPTEPAPEQRDAAGAEDRAGFDRVPQVDPDAPSP